MVGAYGPPFRRKLALIFEQRHEIIGKRQCPGTGLGADDQFGRHIDLAQSFDRTVINVDKIVQDGRVDRLVLTLAQTHGLFGFPQSIMVLFKSFVQIFHTYIMPEKSLKKTLSRYNKNEETIT